jgi:hypothetical protein
MISDVPEIDGKFLFGYGLRENLHGVPLDIQA